MIQIEATLIDGFKNLNHVFWYYEHPRLLKREEYFNRFEQFFGLGYLPKMPIIDATLDDLKTVQFYYNCYLTLINLEADDLEEKVICLDSDVYDSCLIRIKNLNETKI